MMFPVVRELAADGVSVVMACQVLQVSTSGYYHWQDRLSAARSVADAQLTETISAIHPASYGTYGVRRVHAELRLGRQVHVEHKRVERLMRTTGKRCTAASCAAAPAATLPPTPPTI